MKTISIIILTFILSANALAGTLLLMQVGPPSLGPVTPCSNELDFTLSCNSQYITVIGF